MSNDLEQRAVACRHWRWMPGMLVAYDERLGGRWHTRMIGNTPSSALLNANPLPDLTDPATMGCLLALVREAYGKPGIHARRMGDDIWGVYLDPWSKRRPLAVQNTEAEALVAALEAAP